MTAQPYPSTLQVSGVQGTVTDVNLVLKGMADVVLADLDLLLVGPGGQAAVVMSDDGTFMPLPQLTPQQFRVAEDRLVPWRVLDEGEERSLTARLGTLLKQLQQRIRLGSSDGRLHVGGPRAAGPGPAGNGRRDGRKREVDLTECIVSSNT